MPEALIIGFKNWQTTLAGLMPLVYIAMDALRTLTDHNPDTVVDWNMLIPAFFTGLLGVLARDSNKSSKATGVE